MTTTARFRELFGMVCDVLDRFAWWASAMLLGVMVVIVFIELSARYTVGYSFIWVEELARYLMVWMTMLISSSAIRRGELVAVEYVVQRLPEPLKATAVLIARVAAIVLLAEVLYYGLRFAHGGLQLVSPGLGFPIIWAYSAIPIGAAFMLVQMLGQILAPRASTSMQIVPDAVVQGVEITDDARRPRTRS